MSKAVAIQMNTVRPQGGFEMTVTTTFTTNFVKSITLNSDGSQGSLVSLPGGSFGVASTSSGNTVFGQLYNLSGNPTTSSFQISNLGVNAANPAIAHLTNGNNVVVFQDTDSIVFQVNSPTGAIVVSDVDIGDTNSSNPDVTALTGGGFVIVNQDNFSATDNDIDVRIYNNLGVVSNAFAVDSSGAHDTNAKVAGLLDGGFAVTWQRLVAGETEVWRAVYNADGSVRAAAALFDSAGTINENPDIVALANGGFAVVYADNGWDGVEREITYARFDIAGTFQGFTRLNTNTQSEFQPSVVQLSNGVVAISYHDDVFGDTDPMVSFVDGNSGALLSPSGLRLNSSVSNEQDTSIAALNDGRFVVSWHNGSNNDVVAEIHQAVRFSSSDAASDTINGYALVDEMHGNGGDDTLNGLAGNDILFGEAGNDFLNGGAGKDTMYGGGDNDIYFVSSADDRTIEEVGQGTDTVRSLIDWTLAANVDRLELQGTANLTGNGNGLKNTLVGNSGNNILRGAAGNDLLAGGAGNDTLVGGTGIDAFHFNATLGPTNIDKITDYTVVDDLIQLDKGIFTGLAAGWLTAGAFHTGSAAHDASDRIIYNSTTGALLFDKDGIGGTAAVKFAQLSAGLSMNAGEFFIV
ncbi:calcium-binding protein [Mesorhizobium sp. CCNWLY176]|uniref:calcium-binding protein n=2 Tax=Mesorhizobium TaxID=68287 RepID=UPI00301E5D19